MTGTPPQFDVNREALPRRHQTPTITDGGLELIKWVALILMTGDHVNKFLYAGAHELLFDAGRLVMPLFAAVLGVNLARPLAIATGAADRTVGRLLAMGTVATVPFFLLGGDVVAGWPLNILFTLAVGALCIQFGQTRWKASRSLAIGTFIIGGALVEFWWAGPGLLLGAWYLARNDTKAALAFLIPSFIFLCLINWNLWALMSIPVFWICAQVSVRIPRQKAFFYSYYPAHLAVIYLLSWHASK